LKRIVSEKEILNDKIMETKSTGYWTEKKEKLKILFPFITDDDLQFREGKEREMMEVLSYKLGKTTDEFRYFLAKL
jgi:hypothetical protein